MPRPASDVIAEIEASFARDPDMETARRLDLVMWALTEFSITPTMNEVDAAWRDAALDWVDSGADDAALPWPPRRRDASGYKFYVHELNALVRCLYREGVAAESDVWWPDAREWSPIEINVHEATPINVEEAEEWVDGDTDTLLAGAEPLPILSPPNARWTPELEWQWCDFGFDRRVDPSGDQTFRQARHFAASCFTYWCALEGLPELTEEEVLDRLERQFPDATDAAAA